MKQQKVVLAHSDASGAEDTAWHIVGRHPESVG